MGGVGRQAPHHGFSRGWGAEAVTRYLRSLFEVRSQNTRRPRRTAVPLGQRTQLAWGAGPTGNSSGRMAINGHLQQSKLSTANQAGLGSVSTLCGVTSEMTPPLLKARPITSLAIRPVSHGPVRTESSESCCRSSKVLAAGRALEDEANGLELFELELHETNGRQCGLMRTQIPSSNEPWTPLFNPSPGPVSKLCQKSM